MDQISKYLADVEEALLRDDDVLLKKYCADFDDLSSENQAIFAGAIAFLGCEKINTTKSVKLAMVDSSYRIHAARIMLLGLGVHTDEPIWSSTLLDQVRENVIALPGGELFDLFKPLYGLLNRSGLSSTLNHFILDLTLNGALEHIYEHLYAETYTISNINWMIEESKLGLTQAQAILFMYIIPSEMLEVQWNESFAILCANILRALKDTQYWEHAFISYKEILATETGRALIEAWLHEGVDI